jgi:hypothetical protein
MAWTLPQRRYGTPQKTDRQGPNLDDVEKTPVFDRADLAPKI